MRARTVATAGHVAVLASLALPWIGGQFGSREALSPFEFDALIDRFPPSLAGAEAVFAWAIPFVALLATLTVPAMFFFPALLVYVSYGVGKAVVLGFFERLPDRDLLLDTEEVDEADAEMRSIDYNELAPPRRLWWPGRGQPGAPGPEPRPDTGVDDHEDTGTERS